MITLVQLNGISVRISTWVSVLMFVLVLVIYQLMIVKPVESHLKQAKLLRTSVLSEQSRNISDFFKPLQNAVQTTANKVVLSSEFLMDNNKALDGIELPGGVVFLADDKGNVVSSSEQWTLSHNGHFFIKRNSFQMLLNRQSGWTQVFYDAHLQQYVLGYGVVFREGNNVLGVVGGMIPTDEVIASVSTNVNESEVRYFIYSSLGKVIYHPDYSLKLLRQAESYNAGNYVRSVLSNGLAEYIEKRNSGKNIEQYSERADTIFVDAMPIEHSNWIMAVYQSKNRILDQYRYDQLVYWLTCAGFIFVTFIFSYLISKRQIEKRTQRLIEPFSRWGNGSIDVLEKDMEWLNKNKSQQDEFSPLSQEIKRFVTVERRYMHRLREENNDLKDKVEQNRALAQAISYSDNIVILLTPDLNITIIDNKGQRLLGSSKSSLIGQSILSFIHPHMEFIKEQLSNQLRRKGAWQGELILIQNGHTQTDQEVWVNCSITPMRSQDGKTEKYVATFQDISSVKDNQSRIERLAYIDELTGLNNRAFFLAQLEKLVEISKRGRYDFALFYFDIDDFKKVNDFLGHEGGDMLLKLFSDKVSATLRNEDVFARMGGDEFAIVTGGVKSQQDVIAKINCLLDIAKEPFELNEHYVQVGVSIGVTMSSSDQYDAELLLQHADMAMYEAKSQGKNTYHFYSQELNTIAKARIEIEQDLLHAIEHDELELYFQPKVDSRGPLLVGFEALLRWTSKKRGFVSPAEFIPIAEQSNLILKVGDWVLEKAAQFVHESKQNVVVSVNLSAKQFESGHLVMNLNNVITKYGIDPTLLEVEITESSLMRDVEGAIKQLEDIKTLGINISIDDFGTGYSSLSYLKRLPVSTLKIDRSFIKDTPSDKSDVEITSAIIAMATQLGLEVIAEGAETKDQVEFLASQNCFFIQGYFYSKPLPKNDAIVWTPEING
ncbi:EAL domain-containing protein [Psychrosphaera ytuae]|uniref:EAL domain-containing protein n=1 Tax=Psychrosphaera ytuae TaxID=2820710 RepID=A0A975DAP0_9GAMM|nr:EAL domain-containing protein [Psychrosphaera ytuae]QTH63695.1 EAL domain-containing protein [Psychrosphaera ytuae]